MSMFDDLKYSIQFKVWDLTHKRSRTLDAIKYSNVHKKGADELLGAISGLVDSGERRWQWNLRAFGRLKYDPADIAFREVVCYLGNRLTTDTDDGSCYSLNQVSNILSQIWSAHESTRSALTSTQISEMMKKIRPIIMSGDVMQLGTLIIGEENRLAGIEAGRSMVDMMARSTDFELRIRP